MKIFSATFTGNPVPKGRPRMTKTGHAYTPQNTRNFEKAVALWAKSVYKGKPSDKALKVFMCFYINRARSNKTKKHVQKPDLDNYIKAVLDGMQGVVFVDDSQACEITAEKCWADYVEPSFTITIYETEE